MSSEPQPSVPTLPVLSANERRVLGVLVEKAKTTPDVYPMTINAMVTGCNQKSNREPVLNLSDLDVEDALTSAQKKGLVIKIVTAGGRAERWKHNLYEAWKADKVELAILAELLLRGPQTEGELRGRASRMEPIADLDALRALLRPLVERKLVVYLSPEGRRGTMVTHGFHDAGELKYLRSKHADDAAAPAVPAPATPRPPEPSRPTPAPPANQEALAALEARLATAHTEIAELRKSVADLQATVSDLAAQLKGLREALGA
jgi:uncharacterized protein YceH (UPF0502 family)